MCEVRRRFCVSHTIWRIHIAISAFGALWPNVSKSLKLCHLNKMQSIYQIFLFHFADSNNNRNVGPILKLLNVNGYASLLCQASYSGPRVKSDPSATDEALPLSDIKGPVTQDKRQVVKQVYYTFIIPIASLA